MYPTHDADALLMLAATLATKRRPAELVEVIAAFDLLQEPVPSTGRLIDSIQRLSAHGLLCEVDGGLALSAEGQLLMSALPKRGDTAQRVFFVREKLSAHPGRAEHRRELDAGSCLRAADRRREGDEVGDGVGEQEEADQRGEEHHVPRRRKLPPAR